ncbi:MAG TPA: zinc-binding dehydrogenase [Candidatus Omnitrophota bacterium]|nr:zinc-binding dehydrogenase [Candidatus Omnitrophota bacterium]HRY85674.1 zinc-binding dehydrogenase [Candidatus Omnitrophota bacterium]
MEKMKAVIFRKHGTTAELEETYVPVPEIGKKDVLVKVKACSVNHLDLWTLAGMPGVKISMPHILGCDVAGEVVEKGKKAHGAPLHKPVIVAPGISCGKCSYCRSGWDSLCAKYEIVGFQNNGGYAEYIKVPARNIIPVAGKLGPESWAAVPLVFLTAWHILVTRAGLQKKETVLIQGGGSGIGSAAIQIAKLLGARVITTVGSEEKAKRAKAIGADEVILYRQKDFYSEVMRLTKSEGVDVLFEHIGGDIFAKSVLCLKKKGRMITCGATAGRNVSFDLRYLYTRQLSIMGSYMGGIAELQRIVRRIQDGRLKPVIDRIFPLREARQALNRMAARENFGKIILKP